VPYDQLVNSPKFGRELIKVNASGDYCCFRLDAYDTIEAITYLGTAPLEVPNVQQLIGLPQMYLNRLVPRFDEFVRENLPQFVRENWAMALFHDRFGDFRQALKAELLEEEAFGAIAADLEAKVDDEEELPSKAELRAAVQASSRQLVEKRLVEYMQTNQNQLFMYLVPSAAVMRQMEDKDLINGHSRFAPKGASGSLRGSLRASAQMQGDSMPHDPQGPLGAGGGTTIDGMLAPL